MILWFDNKNQRNTFWIVFFILFILLGIESYIKGEDETPMIFLSLFILWIIFYTWIFAILDFFKKK